MQLPEHDCLGIFCSKLILDLASKHPPSHTFLFLGVLCLAVDVELTFFPFATTVEPSFEQYTVLCGVLVAGVGFACPIFEISSPDMTWCRIKPHPICFLRSRPRGPDVLEAWFEEAGTAGSFRKTVMQTSSPLWRPRPSFGFQVASSCILSSVGA